MLWIKRNLFLAIGGFIALALIGVGGWYAYQAINEKTESAEKLKESEAKLARFYDQKPFPAATNVDAAKRETERVQSALTRMQKFFTAPPVERVTGLGFRTYRDNLLAELRKSAAAAGTAIPSPTYAFSFEEQRTRVDFDARTFPQIPEQMADVRAICDVLFDAHVNPIVNIRRARVSGDDERSSNQSDYNFLKMMTNVEASAIISPYEVCFQGLSAELATVVQKLAVSPYGMILKAVQVEPIDAAAGGPAVGNPVPGGPARQRPGPAQPKPNPSNLERGVTLLNEKRFQVSMVIYVVRAVRPEALAGMPSTAPAATTPRTRPPRRPLLTPPPN